MSFYCIGCGQEPCIGKCELLCVHGIKLREWCDECPDDKRINARASSRGPQISNVKPDKTFEQRRDEAAGKYELNCDYDSDYGYGPYDIEDAFKAGADWCRSELEDKIEYLKIYRDKIYDYVQATGNTSPKTLGYHVADALVMDHKDLKAKLQIADALLKRVVNQFENPERSKVENCVKWDILIADIKTEISK